MDHPYIERAKVLIKADDAPSHYSRTVGLDRGLTAAVLIGLVVVEHLETIAECMSIERERHR